MFPNRLASVTGRRSSLRWVSVVTNLSLPDVVTSPTVRITRRDAPQLAYSGFQSTRQLVRGAPKQPVSHMATITTKKTVRWVSSALLNGPEDDDDTIYTPPPRCEVPKFAVVRHDTAYQTAMNGLHGKQLALAQLEGEGKDEPDFDPFLEEELEEARLLAEAEEERQQKASGGSPKQKPVDTYDEEEDENDDEASTGVVDPSSQLSQHRFNRKRYRNDGSLKRNSSEMAILRAGSPAGGLVAIVALAGTQFKVTTDDVVIVNLLKPVSVFAVGSIQTLRDEQVMLVTSSALTLVGMPYVPGAEVDVLIEEITQDAKIVIFKKRRRKNSKRKTGFRRDVTMLRILDIRFPPPYDAHDHVPRPDPAPLIPN